MQYSASYYWQAADGNTTSLVLQQAYHKRRRLPVLSAWVCTDKTARHRERGISEKLTDWFYETALPFCGRAGMKGMETAADKLYKMLEQCMRSGEADSVKADIAGIFCVGSSFQLFWQGEAQIYLLNDRNHHANCRELRLGADAWGIAVQSGNLQRNVGILLSSAGFAEVIPHGIMEECLQVSRLRSQSKTEARLRELGGFAEEQGGRNMGAVLLVSR